MTIDPHVICIKPLEDALDELAMLYRDYRSYLPIVDNIDLDANQLAFEEQLPGKSFVHPSPLLVETLDALRERDWPRASDLLTRILLPTQ